MKLTLLFLWPLATCLAIPKLDGAARPPQYDAEVDEGTHGYYPVRKFTTTKLTAPHVNFLQWSPDCDDGRHYFIAPRGWSVSKPGPMILDGNGTMIWSEHFANEFGGQAYDLRVQKYHGEDYLTFWLGDDRVRGHGAGHYYMLNASYDIVHKVGAANSMYADLHEFLITPEGTALMIIFQVIPADVRPLGRVWSDVWNQAVWDCLFQEVNIDTGELVFQWRASEHVNLTHTYSKLDPGDGGTQQNPFDWLHINSVDKDELGNYLVSARNTHAMIYINGKTGEILWTLGGKGNQFADLSGGYALNFAWQHDARFVSPYALPATYKRLPEKAGTTTRLLTVFDNAAVDWNYAYGPSYSRGLLLEVTYPTPSLPNAQDTGLAHIGDLKLGDPQSHESREHLSKMDAEKVSSINGTNLSYAVRVVQDFVNPKHVRSSTQGSLQLIPEAQGQRYKFLVGYGLNAVMTEFSSNGSVLCDLHLGAESSWERGDIQSYRTYKFNWVGRPSTSPAAAAKGNSVFVSWNGATEVHSWLLQATDSVEGGSLVNITLLRKQGFETTFLLPQESRASRYLRCLALDRNGQLLDNGMSIIVDRGRVTTLLRQRLASGSAPILKVLLLISGAAGLVVSYVLYSRYQSRRRGRPYSGSLRWRRGHAYRALKSAVTELLPS